MKSDLKIGNIVRVSASDCMCYRRQGQVVGFDRSDKDLPVRVWFGKEVDHIHRGRLIGKRFLLELPKKHSVEPPPRSEQGRDPRTWNFSRNQLVVCPTWTVKTLAERHFPNFHHSYMEPENEIFVPGARDCDVEGCEGLATRRILTNVWGTVFTADVCGPCAPEYHLKCGEVFKAKRRERVSA